MLTPQEQVQQRVELPVSHVVQDTVEVVSLTSQEQVQQRVDLRSVQQLVWVVRFC